MNPPLTFPLGKYGLPGILIALSGGMYALEQYASSESWWSDMPWLWLFLSSMAFALGIAYADLWNRDSQLRRWWAYRSRLFDVIAIDASHIMDDANLRGTERIEIWCKVKFIRDISGQFLTVRIVAPLEIDPSRQVTHLIIKEPLGEIIKDDEKRIILGQVSITRAMSREEQEKEKSKGNRIAARHSVWGDVPGKMDIADGQFTIIPNSRNRIEIAVGSQTYKIFAKFFDPNQESARRVFLISQDEDITI